jgi:DNA-binding beta-propeller fold protein YncE
MKQALSILTLLLLTGCVDNSILKEQYKSSKESLSVPESVVYDNNKNSIYVSNVNSIKSANPWQDNHGFISKLDKNGKVVQLKWAVGLQSPKGLALSKNHLFVADLNQVVKIDTTTGKILAKFPAPKGIKMLNDITCDGEKERCFVSDSGTKQIFEVSKSGTFTLLYDKERSKHPEQNGLYLDKEHLIMQGERGKLKSLNLKTKKVTTISDSVGISIDGITKYKEKGYLISTWSGGIYFVDNHGKTKQILSDGFKTADIFYSDDLDLLLVPDFSHHILGYGVELNNK